MAEVTADVAGDFESLWVEAVGVYLVAAVVAVSLIDCLAQFRVVRASLTEVLRIQHKRLGRVEINTAGYGQFINERYGKDEAAEAVVASARSRLAELA